MRKITEIFRSKPRTFSFEVFPPKTDKGMASLRAALAEFERLSFDYASVTYGAGGSNRDRTFDIVREIQEEHGLPALHHFTCVMHTRTEIGAILDRLERSGVYNLLALRGDPPKDQPDWRPGPDNFRYSSELVAFIKERYGERFAVGVAGFPEGHPLAPDRDFDADILKRKIDSGGDFIVTQLFFDNANYFDYVKRLRDRGVQCRIIPGILPITNYKSAVDFAAGCGASIPAKVHEIFGPLAEDHGKTLEAGIAYAVRQCRELLEGGAPGIHFYALNKVEPVASIIRELGVCY
jgi:methylenetetrahydrofolate reductase (NADPH)